MFGNGQDSATLQATTIGQHFLRDCPRILAKSADIDYGIQGIGVHISHRREIDMYAQRTKFTCHLTPVCFYQAVVRDTAQGRITRKLGSIRQTHGQSPLTIHRNQHGNLGIFLHLIRQEGLSFYGSLGEQQATYLIFTHPFLQLLLGRLISHGRYPGNQQLTYLLLQAHPGHDRIHPLPAPGFIRRGQPWSNLRLHREHHTQHPPQASH